MNARYWIAKYIADPRRCEPRNMGVLVWAGGKVESRFLGERPGQPGEVDGRSVPGFANSASAYKQWVRFWHSEAGRKEIAPPSSGRPVPRSSPEFMKILSAYGKGNFVLAEGGFVPDEVRAEDLPNLARQLYEVLVADQAEESVDPTVEEVCESLFAKSRLKDHPFFQRRYSVTCPIGEGIKETIEYDYAMCNGAPQRLIQRVPLGGTKGTARRIVDATAWRFEKTLQSRIVDREHVLALVVLTDEQQNEEEVQTGLRIIGSVGKVLNLSDEREALRILGELAAIPGH